MSNNLDNFYLDQEEPNKSCLLALRSILSSHSDKLSETRKYGMPCFCYENKACCYVWVEKKSNLPYLLLVEGDHLHHPALIKGDRKRMKTFSIDPEKDIPIQTIKEILMEAIDLYTSGKIKLK